MMKESFKGVTYTALYFILWDMIGYEAKNKIRPMSIAFCEWNVLKYCE
jgi:hypothetical protein